MAKIIILNAPPGAGKDTIGALIKDYSPVPLLKMSFKAPMFDIACAMLGKRGYQKFLEIYDDREQKEKPQPFLNGKSPREFMIWISEAVIKPQFGNEYFGWRFAEYANHADIPVICTDGGFPEEIKPLVRSEHEVVICRLHRSGYTFAGDSRDYINLERYHHRIKHKDYVLVDGEPMHTVNQIISDHLAK